ncbi:MAG: hypothetical protein FWC75_05640 [Oscillospiraceae bacterium]|nr:hypothetical protein [Oscillospiraceae bacterium]
MTQKRRSLRAIFAIVLTIVMMLSFAVPALAAPAVPLTLDRIDYNAAARAVAFHPVAGAASFTIWAFANQADAAAATAANVTTLAVASATIPAAASGNTIVNLRNQLFTNVGANDATRTLQAGWTPAGMGTSSAFDWTNGGAYATNLRPAVYWLRFQANPEDTVNNAPSELHTTHFTSATVSVSGLTVQAAGTVVATNQGLVIAMGPDEARDHIETYFSQLGTTLRIADLRGALEAGDEGHLRFTDIGFANTQSAIDAASVLMLNAAGLTAGQEGLITVLVY